MERSYCYRNSIDRFSKELSTNFVETLRNYNENHFDYKTEMADATIAHLNGELNAWGNRSDNYVFDFNSDPEESRKPRRTVSDNGNIDEGNVDRYLNIIVLNEALN